MSIKLGLLDVAYQRKFYFVASKKSGEYDLKQANAQIQLDGCRVTQKKVTKNCSK